MDATYMRLLAQGFVYWKYGMGCGGAPPGMGKVLMVLVRCRQITVMALSAACKWAEVLQTPVSKCREWVVQNPPYIKRGKNVHESARF
jgi:hypothetical protein